MRARGQFVTRKFLHGCLVGVDVAHNEFTDAGLEWLWQMALGQLRDPEARTLTDELRSGRILVGDGGDPFSPKDTRLSGEQTDQRPFDVGFPRIAGRVDAEGELLPDPEGDPSAGLRMDFRSTFGERDANFDWQERGIVTAQGVLIDRSVSDQGRKVLGAVWVVDASLDLLR